MIDLDLVQLTPVLNIRSVGFPAFVNQTSYDNYYSPNLSELSYRTCLALDYAGEGNWIGG